MAAAGPTKPSRAGTPPPPTGSETRSRKWWLETSSRKPMLMALVGDLIRQQQGDRRFALLQWFRLYNNAQMRALDAASYFRPEIDGRQNHLTYNIVKSCVDTVVARVTEQAPRPRFLTNGGKWSDQKRAKRLDNFVDGLFYETKFTAKKAPLTFKEACIFGTASTYVYEGGDGRVKIDRAYIEEILVDEIEAFHGAPRNLYRTRLYSRDEMLAKFKGNAAAEEIIQRAPIARVDGGMQKWAEQTDVIAVVEAWHLPSGFVRPMPEEDRAAVAATVKEAAAAFAEDELPTFWSKMAEADVLVSKGHDGRHVIATENGVLLYEGRREDWFPFSFTHYTEPIRGFLDGQGIPQELAGIQADLNRVLIQLSEALPFVVPKILLHQTTQTPEEWFDDLVMGILKWAGQHPPELMTWNAVPQQLFESIEMLIRRAYELIGLSPMSAQSKKPSDVESAAGFRELYNIESGRFYSQGHAYEELFCDTARLAIRVAKSIAERNGKSYKVRAAIGRRRVKEIDWKDIDLEEDAWIMQVYPVSALPKLPAGRLDMVQDLMKLGFLAKQDALRLINFPDLDSVNEIMEAAAEYTHWQIEQLVEGNPEAEGVQPQPYQDLRYALEIAQSVYMNGITEGLSDRRMNALRGYIDACNDLIVKASQPAPAPGAQPGIPSSPNPTMLAPGVAGPIAGPAPVPMAPGMPPPGGAGGP